MTNDELAALHKACFISPRPWSAAEFDSLLQSPHVFIHIRDGGFIMGRLAGPEVELLTLAVAAELRRHGLARQLLAEFEQTAFNRQATEAFLEVADDNIAAIQLYRSAGYKDAGFRKDYYQSPNGARSAAIVMKRLLSPT